jgi:hypothetical protein
MIRRNCVFDASRVPKTCRKYIPPKIVSATAAELVIRKYLRAGIAVDSGLLILLTVGQYDKSYIAQFKVTSLWDGTDYELLANFVGHFRNIIISPHVLAELSNHSFKVPQRRLAPYLDVFVRLADHFEEVMATKNAVLAHAYPKQVGVADTGLIISCLKGPYFLLTSDRKLRGIAGKCGVDAMHFDELRGYSWFANA